MATNDFAYYERTVYEAALMLRDELLSADISNRSYEGQFTPGVGKTVNVSIPTKGVGQLWEPSDGDITVQDIAQTTVPVTIEKNAVHRVSLTEDQTKFELRDRQTQIIAPAVSAIKGKIEQYLKVKQCQGFATNLVGTAGNDLTTLRHVIDGERTIFDNTDETSNYVGLITSLSDANLGELDAFNSNDFVLDGRNSAIKDGILGKTRRTALIRSQYSGTKDRGDVAGTVLVKGGSQTGTTLVTDGYTAATGSIWGGTRFTIDGVTGVYTVDQFEASISSNEATLTIYPALASSPADDAAITFEAAYKENIFYDPNTFAVAVLPLSPAAAGNTFSATVDGIGISLTVNERSAANLTESMTWASHVGAVVLQRERGCIVNG